MKLHAHRDPLGKISFYPERDGLGALLTLFAGRFFELDHRVAAALALPDLGAAVKQVVRLLLQHSGDGLTDDVLLVLGEPADRV